MSKSNGTGDGVVDGVRIAVGEEVAITRIGEDKLDRIGPIVKVTPRQFVVRSLCVESRFSRKTLEEVGRFNGWQLRVRAVTDVDRAEKRRTVLAATLARYAWDTVPLAVLASVEAELVLPPAGRQRVRTGDAELDRLRFRAAARLRDADRVSIADDIVHDRASWRGDAMDVTVSLVWCVGRVAGSDDPMTMADCARSAAALAALIDLVNADLARKVVVAKGTPS